MKRISTTIISSFVSLSIWCQNTFPSSGNVGIGTDSPNYLLHLQSNDPRIQLQRTGSFAWQVRVNNTGRLIFEEATNLKEPFQIEANAPTNSLHIKNNGNIGIGTSNPEHLLDLISNDPIIQMQRNGSTTWQARINNIGRLIFEDATNATEPFQIETNAPTNSFHIKNNGNIGIGTSNPEQLLHIRSNDPRIQIQREGSTSWQTRVNNAGRLVFEDATSSTEPFQIETNTPSNSLYIKNNGNVGIGTSNPTQKLEVAGTIRSREVKVEIAAGTGPDYVFEPNYELRTLEETKAYITENKHLPEIPSAKEMEASGIEIGDMNMRLLKKIEELTLHQIELLEKLKNQQSELRAQQERITELEKKVE